VIASMFTDRAKSGRRQDRSPMRPVRGPQRAFLPRAAAVLVVGLISLPGPPALAKHPKVPLCGDGRFVVEAPTVLPGDSAPEFLVLTTTTAALGTACPATRAPHRRAGHTTSVRAVWKSCLGVRGLLKLTGTFDADCHGLTVQLKGLRVHIAKTFHVRWSMCGDGVVDVEGGEQCDGAAGCSGDMRCGSDCTCVAPIASPTTTTTPTTSTTTATTTPIAMTTTTIPECPVAGTCGSYPACEGECGRGVCFARADGDNVCGVPNSGFCSNCTATSCPRGLVCVTGSCCAATNGRACAQSCSAVAATTTTTTTTTRRPTSTTIQPFRVDDPNCMTGFPGDQCEGDAEGGCCTGELCQFDGSCCVPPAGRPGGGQCVEDLNCCAGHCIDMTPSSLGVPLGYCCSGTGVGTACSVDDTCCSGTCNEATHKCCSHTGDVCYSDADCCAGRCFDGSCCSVGATGESCSSPGDCCSNHCAQGSCCAPVGAPCSLSSDFTSDCCSGSCEIVLGGPFPQEICVSSM